MGQAWQIHFEMSNIMKIMFIWNNMEFLKFSKIIIYTISRVSKSLGVFWKLVVSREIRVNRIRVKGGPRPGLL